MNKNFNSGYWLQKLVDSKWDTGEESEEEYSIPDIEELEVREMNIWNKTLCHYHVV